MQVSDLTIEDFLAEVGVLRKSVGETQLLRERDLLSVDTRDVVVENAVVRAALLLERLIESHFVRCLLGAVPAGTPHMVASSPHEVGLLLNSSAREEAYLNWLPYKDNTVARAERYLDGGGPFTRLNRRPVEERALQSLTVLRNAAAHDSDDTRRKLQVLADQAGYRCHRPADYLITEREGASELLHLLVRLERIGRAITADTDEEAESWLEDERPYTAKESGPAGSYRCQRCEHRQELDEERVLGRCSACTPADRCETCGGRIGATTTWLRLV